MNPILLYLAWKSTRRAAAGAGRPSRVRGALRVAAYAAFVTAGLGLAAAHKARADVGHAALDVGRELAETTHGLDGGYTATLNGQRFHLGESTTDASVSAVLEDAEKACAERPGALAGLFEAMPTKGTLKGGKPYHLEGSFTHGIVRNGTDKDGVVMCFTGDPEKPRSTTEALTAFAETQDLGALGKLRYTYAKRDAAGKTHVTFASTDAHFSLAAITTGGETLGHDGAVPRPAGSRRILTAAIEGAPQLTNVLESGDKVEKVIAHYDETLKKAGFERITPPSSTHTLRLYYRDGFEVLVAARTQDDKTVFAVTEQKITSKNAKGVLEVSP